MFSNIGFNGLSNSLYTANNVHIRNKSSQTLEDEISKGLNYLQSVSDEKNVKDSDVKVIFQDAKSAKMVSLNLSEKAYDRLRTHFEDNDFYLTDDKQVRLNGEAQNFVSGWFNQVAYGLNWLNADANSDGVLEGAELESARDKYVGGMYQDKNFYFSSRETTLSDTNSDSTSIESKVNSLIEKDIDLDGNVSIGEYLGMNKIISMGIKADNLEKETQQNQNNQSKSDKKEDEDLLEKVLEKGVASLDSSELAEFRQKYPDKYEQIKQQDLNSALNQDFKKQILNADFKMLDIKA